MEIMPKQVSAEFRTIRPKLWENCVLTKLPHQKIRWKYEILRSVSFRFIYQTEGISKWSLYHQTAIYVNAEKKYI